MADHSDPRASDVCQACHHRADFHRWIREPGAPESSAELRECVAPGCQCAGFEAPERLLAL